MAEVVALFAATLLNIRLLWPVHLLWINLVTDSLPALALGMESAESDNMKKPPRSPKSGVFSGGVGINVIYQGLAIGALTLLSYLVGMHYSGADGTTMAFVTLSMCEIFHSLNMRSKDKSIFAMKTVNKYLLGSMVLAFLLTLGVIYTPVNVFFKLVPLPAGEFITAMLLSVAIIPLVEIVKFVAGKMRGRAR
jgi:Ca2+-transporting ATPase